MNVPLVRFFRLPGCGAGGRFLLAAALLAAWAALPEPARAKSETNEWTRVPRFETWPAPPSGNSNAPARAVAPPAQPSQPAAPAAAKDKKLYSFRAENLELKAALALFARANELNIVPDLDATGTITLDVRRLPPTLEEEAALAAGADLGVAAAELQAALDRRFADDVVNAARAVLAAASALAASEPSGAPDALFAAAAAIRDLTAAVR